MKCILYSGKFSHGANFCGFRGWPTTAKIRTPESSVRADLCERRVGRTRK